MVARYVAVAELLEPFPREGGRADEDDLLLPFRWHLPGDQVDACEIRVVYGEAVVTFDPDGFRPVGFRGGRPQTRPRENGDGGEDCQDMENRAFHLPDVTDCKNRSRIRLLQRYGDSKNGIFVPEEQSPLCFGIDDQTIAESFLCRIFAAGYSSSHVESSTQYSEIRAKAQKP